MPSYDANYQGKGLQVEFNNNRPVLTDDSVLVLVVLRRGGHTEVTIGLDRRPESAGQPPRALTPEDLAAIKRMVEDARSQTATNPDQQTREMLAWIARALQIRVNEHWRATGENRSVALEDMMGTMTLSEDNQNVDLAGLLGELTIEGEDETMEDQAADPGSSEPAPEPAGAMQVETEEMYEGDGGAVGAAVEGEDDDDDEEDEDYVDEGDDDDDTDDEEWAENAEQDDDVTMEDY